MNNNSAKEHVQKFAENREEFDATFKSAFVKLSELGSDSQSLTDV